MYFRLLDACRKMLYVKPRLGYNQLFTKEFSMKRHRHDTLEFMYAVNNSFACDILYEDNVLHHLTIRSGGCLLINNAVCHCLVIEKQTRILNIEFEFVEEQEGTFSLQELYRKVPAFARLVNADEDYVVFPNCSQIQTDMIKLLDMIICKNREEDARLLLMQKLYTGCFFIQLSEMYHAGVLARQQWEYIRTAKAFIESSFYEPLTVQKIADSVNVHPNYLEYLFKRAEGKTLVEYINYLRIQRAAYLLRATDSSIEDIAYEVGFNNRQHFSKLFGQLMNASPRQYRMMLSIQNYRNDDVDARMIIENPPK